MVSLWAALANPERYAVDVPTDNCFAVGPIDKNKVWKIIRAYLKGVNFKPLVGIAHPYKNGRITIADGHHRFYAYKELGLGTIRVAVSDDYEYYPIIASGLNQLNMKFQMAVRPYFRKIRNAITGRKDLLERV